MKDNKTGMLIERIYWFVKLRWIAVAGVMATIFFVHLILKISLPFMQLAIVVLILAGYNLIFLFIISGIKKRKSYQFSTANGVANAQISLDFLILTVLIHFSGGIENPFIFYFIFHMIIASILLSRRASLLQATFAIFLFSSTVSLEYLGIIPHYCLKGFVTDTLHNNLSYIFGVSFVFISTLYIAVYMATSIAVRLRKQEENLEDANKLLKEKDHIKSEYVLRLSHDIREHLSAIQSCLEPIEKGITGSLNEKQLGLLNRANNRIKKLSFFVKALLEITKIKLARKIILEWFSFSDILKSISEDISARAKNKNIIFETKIGHSIDKIKGVRLYIEETISNLLVNAVKYTPAGGQITLTVKDAPEKISIQIRDSGIGIPEEDLPHIFEEFYRAGNAKRIEKQGTGLGLSMAKEIVELHKGKIWVESKENEGSNFFIEIPK